MQRTDFGAMRCSIARTLDIAGEPWSPLIMRDVYVGIRRFDDLQRDLGISRKVLTQRLEWLVDRGMLARRRYSERPPRWEYVLTEQGLAFCDILLLMTAWGDRWAVGPEGPPVLHRHRTCGAVTHVHLTCSECGQSVTAADIEIEPGTGGAEPDGVMSR